MVALQGRRSLVPGSAFADMGTPVSLEDCLKSAPIILLAQEGQKEFEDLKEGTQIKTTLEDFIGRNQKFRILKIIRNATSVSLQSGTTISVNQTYDYCQGRDITVRKTGGKLQILPRQSNDFKPYFVDVKKSAEPFVLFLKPHFGGDFSFFSPSVEPEKLTKEMESKIASLPKFQGQTISLEIESAVAAHKHVGIGNIAPYRKELFLEIAKHWKTQSSKPPGKYPVLNVQIGRDGRVVSRSICEPTNARSDNEALKAIDLCKFQPLPEWYRGDQLNFKIEMVKVDQLRKAY